MLTKLNSFGCSFTSGTELSDCGPNECSNLTWPALIAKKHGRDYLCHAQGGTGNLAIAQRVINRLAVRTKSNEPFVWIVNWTFLHRFDFISSNDTAVIRWETLCAARTDDVARAYFQNLNSEPRDKLVNLLRIQSVISLLLQEKIPFVMTCMDYLLLDSQYHCPPTIRYLQDWVRPYITWFEGENFLDWSKKQGFPIGPLGHPLEEAHEAAAELMTPVIGSILHKA